MSYKGFASRDTVLLMIDHQIGTMRWAKSMEFNELKRNALMLAKTAKILSIPTLFTTSMEDHAQGPLLPELEAFLPSAFASRVKRQGIVNAMEDEQFAAAFLSIGRRKVIIAGVTNDVCTVFPALSLVLGGYEVQVVADAGASPTEAADRIALSRMQQSGVTITSTNQVIAELTENWATPEGLQIVQGVLTPALQG